jgi:hypothetical protein
LVVVQSNRIGTFEKCLAVCWWLSDKNLGRSLPLDAPLITNFYLQVQKCQFRRIASCRMMRGCHKWQMQTLLL